MTYILFSPFPGEFVGHVYKRSGYHQRPNVSVPLCPEFFEASWHDLLYAVKDVYVFEGAGRRPFWFENRQGPAEYSIINFQGEGSTGSFVPVRIEVLKTLVFDQDYSPDHFECGCQTKFVDKEKNFTYKLLTIKRSSDYTIY